MEGPEENMFSQSKLSVAVATLSVILPVYVLCNLFRPHIRHIKPLSAKYSFRLFSSRLGEINLAGSFAAGSVLSSLDLTGKVLFACF